MSSSVAFPRLSASYTTALLCLLDVHGVSQYPCRAQARVQALCSVSPFLERVMYSGVSTYCAHSVVVIPAHAGIQAAPRIWIPAYAGMTFPPLSMHIAKRATCITRSRALDAASRRAPVRDAAPPRVRHPHARGGPPPVRQSVSPLGMSRHAPPLLASMSG
jgi:hypothetical protein